MRILIAEDDMTSRIMLAEVLKRNGHDVVVTVDGAGALRALQQPDAPKLAILDWLMPELSGVDVCRQVRSASTDQPPYIIMLTSKGEKADIVAGLEAGADDYLAKPFVLEELRARVDVGRRMLDLQAAMADKVRQLTLWQNQMVRELKLAAQLQTKLLTTAPLFTARHEVRMLYRPCQHVGGDFLDALELPDGRLCVYVGDVSGHGVGPAMLAALMKAVISDVVRTMPDAGPAAMCSEISLRFREQVSDPDTFVTLFLLLHDAEARQWRGMNCGHPPPFLFTMKGEDLSSTLASKGGLPIGVEAGSGAAYDVRDEVTAAAAIGDLVFLFTDGLLDARNRATGTPCGTYGLAEALTNAARDPRTIDYPAETVRHLSEAGYSLNRDDCCALSVRVNIPAEQRLSLTLDSGVATAAGTRKSIVDALAAEDWPESMTTPISLVADAYFRSALAHDRIPPSSFIRLYLRVVGATCRLLICSEGRERDGAARLADLRQRIAASGDNRALALLEAANPNSHFFRRGTQNVGHFVFVRPSRPSGSGSKTRLFLVPFLNPQRFGK